MELMHVPKSLVSYDEMLYLLRQYRPMKKRAVELKSILDDPPVSRPAAKMGSAFILASDLHERFAFMVEQSTEAMRAEQESLSYITHRLERLILLLAPAQKDIICALYIDGHTYDEVSARYHIARSTVSRRVQKSIRDMCAFCY